ncbi:MAG: hypothetical protein AAF456_16625 [Planctomycetota bacterium]
MKQESAQLNLNSSRTGSHWLQQLKNVALRNVDADQEIPEILVVQFPDLRQKSDVEVDSAIERVIRESGRKFESGDGENEVFSGSPVSTGDDDRLETSGVTPELLAAIAEAENIAAARNPVQKRGNEPFATESAVAPTQSLISESGEGTASVTNSTGTPQVPISDAPAVGDISAPPETWQPEPTQKPAERKKEKDNDEDQPGKKDVDSEAIESLVGSIVERFPPDVPFVLMFAGSEDNPHCEETCARVALSLAQRVPGKVLLIDSDFERAKLSETGANNGEFGLTTWLTRDVRWENLIARKSGVGLEFMPLGQKPVKYWNSARQKVLPLVRQLQQNYQYICVSVGDAHDKASSLWADIADGTYLIVSLTWSSQTVARSANEYLKSIGARVIGCVVTETSE